MIKSVNKQYFKNKNNKLNGKYKKEPLNKEYNNLNKILINKKIKLKN
jgi:hypothetical protein